MTLPIQGNAALVLAVVFGMAFGCLLQRGRVVYYNVIVRQFLLTDFTVIRVMLTAVVVGGIGIYSFHQAGLASYHIKSADLFGIILGSAIFGIGMVLYGYCPGTGVAAVATGSVHALVGFVGMLLGGILYALSFAWVKDNILSVWSLGKVRLPDITGIPDLVFFGVLIVAALIIFKLVRQYDRV